MHQQQEENQENKKKLTEQNDTMLLRFVLSKYQKLEFELNKLAAEKKEEEKVSLSSHETDKINAALAKAQSEMVFAGKSKKNFYGNGYADLESVIKACRPALSKNGICYSQATYINKHGQMVLRTELGHSSGQSKFAEMWVNPPQNDNIQKVGSYMTYVKRYSLASLAGVIDSDSDDDGESAIEDIKTSKINAQKPANIADKKGGRIEYISKDQLEELYYELNGYDDIKEDILEKMNLNSLAYMPKIKFLTSIKKIREIKQLREGK